MDKTSQPVAETGGIIGTLYGARIELGKPMERIAGGIHPELLSKMRSNQINLDLGLK